MLGFGSCSARLQAGIRSARKCQPEGWRYISQAKFCNPSKNAQLSMIVNRQRRVTVAIRPLQQFYERARRELGFAPGSVDIQLISDDAMTRLNETFRSKHGPTDVLTFPVNDARPKHGAGYVGDIAISPETARRNARRFSRSFPAEMRTLILHGMIHLAGFDHETDHGEMDRLERRLRKRLGVGARPGAARR
jgi:probable rRNA maturation factor